MHPPFEEWWKGHIVLPLSPRPSLSAPGASNLHLSFFRLGHPHFLFNIFNINELFFMEKRMHSVIEITVWSTPSWHMTFIQLRLNVDATSWPCIDIEATLCKRHVSAGTIIIIWWETNSYRSQTLFWFLYVYWCLLFMNINDDIQIKYV